MRKTNLRVKKPLGNSVLRPETTPASNPNLKAGRPIEILDPDSGDFDFIAEKRSLSNDDLDYLGIDHERRPVEEDFSPLSLIEN